MQQTKNYLLPMLLVLLAGALAYQRCWALSRASIDSFSSESIQHTGD